MAGLKTKGWVALALTVLLVAAGIFLSFDKTFQTSSAQSASNQTQTTQSAPKNVNGTKKLVYIVSDLGIPFWQIMSKGVQTEAKALGYSIDVYSSGNDPKSELELVAKAIANNVSGIVISPTTSLACATILKIAKEANVPVVISDIGTDSGEYVSYISSNNHKGAYEIGKVLARELMRRGWSDASVGIVAIPQKRLNGQARTQGFMKAMDEAKIKGADLKQQALWTEKETYDFSREMIEKHPDLRALWLQGSDRYRGALRAIEDTGKKEKVVLLTFDAEPEFIDLISKGVLIGSAMQQPYLMGQYSVQTMDKHLRGEKVDKNIQLPILAVSKEAIASQLPTIKRNVLGIETDED